MMDDPVEFDPATEEHLEVNKRHRRILEALLFASSQPLSAAELSPYLGEGADIEGLLLGLCLRRRRGGEESAAARAGAPRSSSFSSPLSSPPPPLFPSPPPPSSSPSTSSHPER